MIVCIFSICVNYGYDNSQDSLNEKRGKETMDITVASSDVSLPAKKSEGKVSEPKIKECTGSMTSE